VQLKWPTIYFHRPVNININQKILSSNSCLHTLLTPKRNNEVLSKLRKPLKYPVPYSKTKIYQSFLNYGLTHFQNSNDQRVQCVLLYIL